MHLSCITMCTTDHRVTLCFGYFYSTYDIVATIAIHFVTAASTVVSFPDPHGSLWESGNETTSTALMVVTTMHSDFVLCK